MAFHFSLALLAAILLNGAVLGDDSTSSGALAGADGERNAPSRGGDAGRKSDGRARNGDKLVVLDSARTTPSETARKSVSAMKRMSSQSSLSSRNEARNDHAGVGSEQHDQPATRHKAQASAGDMHGMRLPRARRPAASRHSEGGLTAKSPKESAEVLDRKKEFESMVSGIIAEEAEYSVEYDYGYTGVEPGGYNYDRNGYGSPGANDEFGPQLPLGGSSSAQHNVSVSVSASSSTPSAVSSSDSDQSSTTENKDWGNKNDDKAPKNAQDEEKGNEKEKKQNKKKEDEKEMEEKQLGEQRGDENSNGQETNSSSEDTENENAPSQGNSASLCGSYSSVLLVAVACLCACAC